MNLYNQIKKYTEGGKLVVTKNPDLYYVYGKDGYGKGDLPKLAFTELKRYQLPFGYQLPFDENGIYDNETLLGFYNPDTGEVEPIEESKPIEIEGVKKGFDPENLTFDGVEILAGDEVFIANDNDKYGSSVLLDDGKLTVSYPSKYIPIADLRITKHSPQKSEPQKSELEKKIEEAEENLRQTHIFVKAHFKNGTDQPEDWTSYYQARKTLETLKNNNQ